MAVQTGVWQPRSRTVGRTATQMFAAGVDPTFRCVWTPGWPPNLPTGENDLDTETDAGHGVRLEPRPTTATSCIRTPAI